MISTPIIDVAGLDEDAIAARANELARQTWSRIQ